jgi:hypothetical protein
MNDLERRLASLRRRIRAGRAAEAGARGAFYASLAACALLAALRIGGLLVPGAVAWAAIAAVALALALREGARSFTIRDCAIHLDRLLGLEERLSTAVEADGPMHDAQAADAAAALSRVAIPARRLPREARLLAGSALLVGAILLIRTPASAGGADDPALVAVSDDVVRMLENATSDRIEFREVAEMIKRGRLDEAAAGLRSLADRLEQERLQGGGGAQAEKEREAATAGAAALSAELARLGRPVRATPPTIVALKLERQRLGGAPASSFTGDPGTARAVATALERADWAPRYDAVIRTYFGSDSR